jgi:hypothetical protein
MFDGYGQVDEQKQIVEFLFVDNLITIGTAGMKHFCKVRRVEPLTVKFVLNHFAYVVNSQFHNWVMNV